MRFTPALLLLLACSSGAAHASELTVATFNTWYGRIGEGRPIAETIAVLEALDADVIALQEIRAESPTCTAEDCPPAGPSIAGELAGALGYHLFEQAAANDALWASAILSRYPIVATLDMDLGVVIDVDDRRVAVLNVHLTDYPYQPYQLSGIDYGAAPTLHDEAAAIEAAEKARGAAVDRVLDVAARVSEAALLAICGDFNEPSHLDWTDRAAGAGRHPVKVRFPASAKLAKAGFVDGYRAARPDEVAFPGFTWTPLAESNDENEHHDRIDFVYLKGAGLRVVSAEVAGESPATSDIVVEPWPSDHRAVRVRLEF